jgi:hypothetical protein
MSEPDVFPVDTQIAEIMSRVSQPIKNRDAQVPRVEREGTQLYLEISYNTDPGEESEVNFSRAYVFEDVHPDKEAYIREQLASMDFDKARTEGIIVGIEKIQDKAIQGMVYELLNFLEDRQKKILLYLYREAAAQSDGPMVTIDTNDLMAALNYSKSNNGYFASSDRQRLSQDLATLENVKITIGKPLQTKKGVVANFTRLSLISIRGFQRTGVEDPDFDWRKAIRLTSDLPSELTIRLEIWNSIEEGRYIALSKELDIAHVKKQGRHEDYSFKLLMYLAGQISRKGLVDGKYLSLIKHYVFKNMGLLGKNDSRNNATFRQATQKLVDQGYLHAFSECTNQKSMPAINFEINKEKICLMQKPQRGRRKQVSLEEASA